jgi:hypothetical protein
MPSTPPCDARRETPLARSRIVTAGTAVVADNRKGRIRDIQVGRFRIRLDRAGGRGVVKRPAEVGRS